MFNFFKKMNQVICIGSACRDIFFPTADGVVLETPEDLLSQKKIAFELGAKYKVEERHESLGGCAANVACGLSRLGIEVACYAHIGSDAGADWIEKELEDNGVKIDLITREKNCPADLSAIIVDSRSGERVIFSNQKANASLEIVADKLQETKWFFIGDLHGAWEKHLEEIVAIAQEQEIQIAINPRQANIHDNAAKVIEIIAHAQVLFLNKDESIEIVTQAQKKVQAAELQDEIFLLRALKDLGPQVVVVTDGIRGAWSFDGETMAHADAIIGQPKDATGAGDAFASGFLAAHLKGKKLEECLRWGIANSTSSLGFYGGVAGLLAEEEILAQAEECQVKNL